MSIPAKVDGNNDSWEAVKIASQRLKDEALKAGELETSSINKKIESLNLEIKEIKQNTLPPKTLKEWLLGKLTDSADITGKKNEIKKLENFNKQIVTLHKKLSKTKNENLNQIRELSNKINSTIFQENSNPFNQQVNQQKDNQPPEDLPKVESDLPLHLDMSLSRDDFQIDLDALPVIPEDLPNEYDSIIFQEPSLTLNEQLTTLNEQLDIFDKAYNQMRMNALGNVDQRLNDVRKKMKDNNIFIEEDKNSKISVKKEIENKIKDKNKVILIKKLNKQNIKIEKTKEIISELFEKTSNIFKKKNELESAQNELEKRFKKLEKLNLIGNIINDSKKEFFPLFDNELKKLAANIKTGKIPLSCSIRFEEEYWSNRHCYDSLKNIKPLNYEQAKKLANAIVDLKKLNRDYEEMTVLVNNCSENIKKFENFFSEIPEFIKPELSSMQEQHAAGLKMMQGKWSSIEAELQKASNETKFHVVKNKIIQFSQEIEIARNKLEISVVLKKNDEIIKNLENYLLEISKPVKSDLKPIMEKYKTICEEGRAKLDSIREDFEKAKSESDLQNIESKLTHFSKEFLVARDELENLKMISGFIDKLQIPLVNAAFDRLKALEQEIYNSSVALPQLKAKFDSNMQIINAIKNKGFLDYEELMQLLKVYEVDFLFDVSKIIFDYSVEQMKIFQKYEKRDTDSKELSTLIDQFEAIRKGLIEKQKDIERDMKSAKTDTDFRDIQKRCRELSKEIVNARNTRLDLMLKLKT
jgi:hypothetical protein